MSELRPGTARAALYAVLAAASEPLTCGDIIERVGVEFSTSSMHQALAVGAELGEVTRAGRPRHYSYSLTMSGRGVARRLPGAAAAPAAPAAKNLAPPLVAKHATSENDGFASSLGTRCTAVVPENRSQGTIEEALRAVLSPDAPLPLAEVLRLLPIGWSRTQAISGLKEGALDGWVNYSPDGWELVGEPPEPRTADPLSVAAIPDHMHLRLQDIAGDLREQLRDAITTGRSAHLVRALASAGAEIATALTLIDD